MREIVLHLPSAIQAVAAALLPMFALAWLVHVCRRLRIRPLGPLLGLFRRLPPLGRVVLGGLLAAGIAFGGGKGETNAPPARTAAPRLGAHVGSPGSGPFVPACVEGPAESFAEPPEGAVTNARWRLRGAFADAFAVPFPAGFPWRDGVSTSLVVFASGEVRPDVAADYPSPPFAEGLSLPPRLAVEALGLPPESGILWHALTPSNSLLATWRGAFLGRSAAFPVDLQAEAFADGTLVYRLADRTLRHAAVLPFDWDGDGLENSVDPEPCLAGPDAHNTNAEWYNVVCGGILSATEDASGDMALAWRGGVNTNAYYFVDVVVANGPAPVYFSDGMGRCADDPAVVALPGVTNRVPLVIGPLYTVTSTVPFEISVPEDTVGRDPKGCLEIVRDGDDLRRATVRWPVSFSYEDEDDSCRNFTVTPTVDGLDFVYAWTRFGGGARLAPRARLMLAASGGCDCFQTCGSNVVVSCSGSCDCEGCTLGGYGYILGHGVALPTISCGCAPPPEDDNHEENHVPQEGSISGSLGARAVIFEDAYVNAPGQTVGRRSTQTTVYVSAYGGDHGGRYSFTVQGLNRLEPIACGPLTISPGGHVGPGQSYSVSFLCGGLAASEGQDDVSLSGKFVEDGTGNVHLLEKSALTVVRVELRATVDPPNPDYRLTNRHKFGVREYVQCLQTPEMPRVDWRMSSGAGSVYRGAANTVQCPLGGGQDPLTVTCMGTEYVPLVEVVEPNGVHAEYCNGPNMGSVLTFPGVTQGMAGGIGMLLHFYIRPDSVSFTEISIQEVVSFTYSAEGYFLNPYFNGDFAHTGGVGGAGAGIWNRPDGIGYFALDHAAYKDRVPWLTPLGLVTNDPTYSWANGYVYIDNPFGWTIKNPPHDASPDKRFGESIQDEIMLTSDGTVGVRKLGKDVSRTTNNVIRINGRLVQ